MKTALLLALAVSATHLTEMSDEELAHIHAGPVPANIAQQQLDMRLPKIERDIMAAGAEAMRPPR